MPEPSAREARDAGGRPDKRWVRRSFGLAADGYDPLAVLQRQVANRLIERIAHSAVDDAAIVLDIGAGTGYCTGLIAAFRPDASVIALDLAEAMLRRILQSATPGFAPYLVSGDAEALPIGDGLVDLVTSNLALQWCPHPALAIREFARVLRSGGQLLFSTFGPKTLCEMREAWAQVDQYTHVNTFITAEELRESMIDGGLEPVCLDTELRMVRYPDVTSLMRELKGLGAHNVTSQRPRGLSGKGKLARMTAAYPQEYRGGIGEIRASFEVIYGVARRMAR